MVEFTHGQASPKDILINGQVLEIKTVTDGDRKDGAVTLKWTSDTFRVDQEMDKFRFESGILLERIKWGFDEKSLFYIPHEALTSVVKGYASPATFCGIHPARITAGLRQRTSL